MQCSTNQYGDHRQATFIYCGILIFIIDNIRE